MTMLRAWSREAVVRGLWRSGALALTRPWRTDRLVILRYHSVCADHDQPAYVSRSIALPVSAFDRQMRHLSAHYACISLDEAADCLSAGRPFPPRSVVVTFDDGYRDNYEHALPVLAKYGVPATIYLVSSTLTERRMLWTSRLRQALVASQRMELQLPGLQAAPLSLRTDADRAASARTLTNVLNQMASGARHEWVERIAAEAGAPAAPEVRDWFLVPDQIAEMRRHRITFGAHTVTHPNLPGIAADEARREVEGSRADLESALGGPVHHFSYPNSGSLHPHFSDPVVGFVRDAGYRTAVTSQTGACRPASDPLRLQRVGINRARASLPRFSLLLETVRLARISGEDAVQSLEHEPELRAGMSRGA